MTEARCARRRAAGVSLGPSANRSAKSHDDVGDLLRSSVKSLTWRCPARRVGDRPDLRLAAARDGGWLVARGRDGRCRAASLLAVGREVGEVTRYPSGRTYVLSARSGWTAVRRRLPRDVTSRREKDAPGTRMMCGCSWSIAACCSKRSGSRAMTLVDAGRRVGVGAGEGLARVVAGNAIAAADLLYAAEQVRRVADLRLDLLLAVAESSCRHDRDDHAALVAGARLEGGAVVALVLLRPAHAVAALALGGVVEVSPSSSAG